NVKLFDRCRLWAVDGNRWPRQAVIIYAAEFFDKFAQPARPADRQWFCAAGGFGCDTHRTQKRQKPAAMIRMKMRDPYRVEFVPRQIFGKHPRRSGRRTIQQNAAFRRFEPICRRRPFSVRNGGSRTENDKLHLIMISGGGWFARRFV